MGQESGCGQARSVPRLWPEPWLGSTRGGPACQPTHGGGWQQAVSHVPLDQESWFLGAAGCWPPSASCHLEPLVLRAAPCMATVFTKASKQAGEDSASETEVTVFYNLKVMSHTHGTGLHEGVSARNWGSSGPSYKAAWFPCKPRTGSPAPTSLVLLGSQLGWQEGAGSLLLSLNALVRGSLSILSPLAGCLATVVKREMR